MTLANGRRGPLSDWLVSSRTDGFAVVHDGSLVYERYLGSMRDSDVHLLQSAGKSLTAALVGVLADAGALEPRDPLTDYVPRLEGSAWEGCTIQHLLDMRAGVLTDDGLSEESPDTWSDLGQQLCEAMGWSPRTRPEIPATYMDYLAHLEPHGAHGRAFHYRSALTDMLGWVAEEAGGEGLADLVERYVWRPLGTEEDAHVILTRGGLALGSGGYSSSLRDFARFGQMWLDDGRVDGAQVLPREWVAETTSPSGELISAFATAGEAGRSETPGECVSEPMYHNCVWTLDSGRPTYAFRGAFGQWAWIDEPARLVIVKVASGARYFGERTALDDLRVFDAIRTALAG